MMAFFRISSVMSILVFSIPALAIDQNVINIKPGVTISEQKFSNNARVGVIKNIRSCGGSAQVSQWRYGACLDSDAVCRIPTDGVLRTAQVDFIPSEDIEKPALRMIVKSNDGKVTFLVDDGTVIHNTGVSKGVPYTVTAFGSVNEELKGKDAIYQYIVYDLSNGAIAFCVEGDFYYY